MTAKHSPLRRCFGCSSFIYTGSHGLEFFLQYRWRCDATHGGFVLLFAVIINIFRFMGSLQVKPVFIMLELVMCQKSNVGKISDPDCESIPFEVLSILTVFVQLFHIYTTHLPGFSHWILLWVLFRFSLSSTILLILSLCLLLSLACVRGVAASEK